ncbi:MAG: glycosyltransferase family 2 protein [Candidatus Omnitrophica bacterium]|nr:glycosyltransferase family 2 protein [Candidatus Omnitrophota bacterium]
MDRHVDYSIVITTHNRLRLLKRAVESALSQTVTCEVVVADDYSTDGTREYCAGLGESIVYHRNQRAQGRASNLNGAVEAAKGDWIKLLDDDDYMAPNCIEEMAKAIARHPQAVICSGRAIQVDTNEKEISRDLPAGPGIAFYIPKEEIYYAMFMEAVPLRLGPSAVRREAFIKSGGFNTSFDKVLPLEEVVVFIEMARFGDIIFINRSVVYVTIWSGNLHKKHSIDYRLQRNICIKEKLSALLKAESRKYAPDLRDMVYYLRLHWGIAAIREGKFFEGIRVFFSAIWSYRAWALLIKIFLMKRRNYENPHLHKIILY